LLVSLYSGIALLLSAIGLYGVLTYSVTQRRREIGIRIAVGAQTWSIVRLVVRQGSQIVGLGLAIALIATFLLSRFMSSVLYGVSANDPLTLGLASLVLVLAGLIACLLPALRAAKTNPIVALRE
jgi:ABC-type antimicrobial peptide transport system permease subunit